MARRKKLTGTQMLEQARKEREAAEASGVSTSDYLDAKAAELLGITVDEYRRRAGR